MPAPLFRKGTILAATLVVMAASCDTAAQRFTFKSYTKDQGLANLASTCLLQDSEGFIWVGTMAGLFRYDGQSFHEFAPTDPSDRSIQAVHQSIGGELWVATQQGHLLQRKGDHLEPVLLTGTIDLGVRANMNSFASDRQNRLYIATSSGLARLTSEDSGRYRVEWLSRLPSSGVTLDRSEVVWFGCRLDLCRNGSQGTERVARQLGLPQDRWESILFDVDGNLWVRSSQNLYEVVKGTNVAIKQEITPDLGTFVNASVAPLLALPEGGVLVPTEIGLAVPDGQHWKLINTNNGLGSDAVCCAVRDKEGSLWVAQRGAGVERWLGYPNWESWRKADGLSNDMIWAIREGAQGTIWLGTNDGLDFLDLRTLRWRRADTRKRERQWVRAVAVDKSGNVWASTSLGGISQFAHDGRLIATYGAEAGLLNNRIWGLLVDQKNQLWVSTSGGVFRSSPLPAGSHSRASAHSGVHFEVVSLPGTDPSEVFHQPMLDRQGRLWIPGTLGLLCFHDGIWRRYRKEDGLRHNSILSVSEAADGAIWMAYVFPLGVTRIEVQADGRLVTQPFGQNNGLHSEKAYFVGGAPDGSVWVGTDVGVDVLSRGEWQHYGRAQGLIWDDCDTNAFLAASDGTFWIGTSRGLSHFTPRHSPPGEAAPQVALTSIKFDSQPQPLQKISGERSNERHVIPYSRNSAYFSFTSLTFLHEEDVSFSYRLVNFKDDWVETTQREALFHNLPGGSYFFEVMARIPGGSWSNPQTFAFTILAPWWESWEFRLTALLLAGAFGYMIWRWRLRRLLKQRETLEREVATRTAELQSANSSLEEARNAAEAADRAKSSFLANMSHEIRTPINGILGMTELALATSLTSEQRELLTLAKTSGDILLDIINDILDYSKIEACKLDLENISFDLVDLLSSAIKAVGVLAHKKGLELAIDVVRPIPSIVSGDPSRLRQILVNLLGNALKFTSKGEVAVLICPLSARSGEVTELHFTIQDTGIGIPQHKLTTIFAPFEQGDTSDARCFGGSGLGLAISKRIVEMMGGKIWAESEIGRGSRFHFVVPLRYALESYFFPAGLPVLKGARVLVVEPNATCSAALSHTIQHAGAIPIAAHSAQSAMELMSSARCEDSPFDCLIFADTMLTVEHGKKAQHLLSFAEKTKTIILRSSAGTGDGPPGKAPGSVIQLSKPIVPRDLLQAMIAICSPDSKLKSEKKPSIEDGRPVDLKLSVLLAEDNAVNQLLALKLLERMGCSTVLAANGTEAVAAFEADSSFDVVLMDIQMPKMDGFEATRQIRAIARQRDQHPVIVAMTAHTMQGDKERCLSSGMDAYISKPISFEALRAVLESHCRTRLCSGSGKKQASTAR